MGTRWKSHARGRLLRNQLCLFSFSWISAFSSCLLYSPLIADLLRQPKLNWPDWFDKCYYWLLWWDLHTINHELPSTCRWGPWSNSVIFSEQRMDKPYFLKHDYLWMRYSHLKEEVKYSRHMLNPLKSINLFLLTLLLLTKDQVYPVCLQILVAHGYYCLAGLIVCFLFWKSLIISFLTLS